MPRYDRSGHRLVSMELGRWQCLRQEWMTAGEVITPTLKGWIRLSQLREPMATDVQVTMAAFYTPMRYLWDGWLDYIKEGVDSTATIPTRALPTGEGQTVAWDSLGLGDVRPSDVIAKHWTDNWRRIWWWYMRFPDDTEALDPYDYGAASNDILRYGRKAVSLESLATRLRREPSLDGNDFELTTKNAGSGREKFDLRDLGQLQARLSSEVTRDWYARDRYQEVMNEIWHTNVGENPEERPFLVGHHEGWMSGRDLAAMDGDNLGAVAGAMKVDIAHSFGPILAPEHGVLSYWMTLRIPPVYAEHSSFLATTDDWRHEDWTGEPGLLASRPPFGVKRRQIVQRGEDQTVLGYTPAGQHLRTGWSSIDSRIADRHTTLNGLKLTEGWYHPSVSHAFVSLAYGEAYGALRFEQPSRSLVPDIKSSIYAGTR